MHTRGYPCLLFVREWNRLSRHLIPSRYFASAQHLACTLVTNHDSTFPPHSQPHGIQLTPGQGEVESLPAWLAWARPPNSTPVVGPH